MIEEQILQAKEFIEEADEASIDIDMNKFEALDIPQCKNCGDIARPNILMFGD